MSTKSSIPVPQYLGAKEDHYSVYSELEFKTEIQKHLDSISQQCADRQLQQNQQLTLYIIASNAQRQLEIAAMLPPISSHLCIRVVSEEFPFAFHAYRFRGRTCVGVIVDSLIAEEFFADFPKPFEQSATLASNHQGVINLSLSTVCFNSPDKEYKDFYFIV